MKTEEFEEPEHISIHASAKEATQRIKRFSMLSRFQSTPPRRRRRYEISELKKMFGISIHASAKEATDSQTKSTTAAKFQSTPPRRRRLKSPSFDTVSATDFNPRLREGGDKAFDALSVGVYISIHASAKEATATYCDTSAIMYISSLNNFFVHYF